MILTKVKKSTPFCSSSMFIKKDGWMDAVVWVANELSFKCNGFLKMFINRTTG